MARAVASNSGADSTMPIAASAMSSSLLATAGATARWETRPHSPRGSLLVSVRHQQVHSTEWHRARFRPAVLVGRQADGLFEDLPQQQLFVPLYQRADQRD